MHDTDESVAFARLDRTGLAALHARIAPHFRRREARERARRYLEGLLRRIERKNGWQLAEALGEGGPQGMQRLLNAAEMPPTGTRRRCAMICAPTCSNT
jgi:hypothetical protein